VRFARTAVMRVAVMPKSFWVTTQAAVASVAAVGGPSLTRCALAVDRELAHWKYWLQLGWARRNAFVRRWSAALRPP
jgi:hypothetical protein